MHAEIAKHMGKVARVCREYQVRRLALFGSAARRDDFDPESSDANFTAEFDPPVPDDLPRRFVGVQDALSGALGRRVDLVRFGVMRNPYRLASMERDMVEVFHAA